MTTADALNGKLERIRQGRYTPNDFVIADAKDADMGFGACAPGEDPNGRLRTKAEYLDAMRTMCASTLVDIMLMSVSSAHTLVGEGLFKRHGIYPAVRLNDTTDIWCARQGSYREHPSRPFATTDVEAARALTDLGLWSMTFSNDLAHDHQSLTAYRDFRLAARGSGLTHFLEVFNPAFDVGIKPEELGFYINDMIIKAVAGVAAPEAPRFLKIQFNGHRAMEELCRYDPAHLIVGILGGAKGTTRDTFELIHQAEQAGARVALFGRKINLSESPVHLVSLMRSVIEGSASPAEAVDQYHAHLAEQNIAPQRSLEKDRQITDPVLRQ